MTTSLLPMLEEQLNYEAPDVFNTPLLPHAEINGRQVVNFGGCSYLGLSHDPDIAAAAKSAIDAWGLANNLPRRYGVSNPVFLEIEEKAAAFFGTQAAFCCATGYLSSPIAILGLATEKTHFFVDRISHHSIQCAAGGAGRPVTFFPHAGQGGDPHALRKTIRAHLKHGERPVVLVDAVTGTFGDIAPLDIYLPVVEEFDGMILVDDAHSAGVLGEQGRGIAEYFGFSITDRIVNSCTLSKAFSSSGGLVYGDLNFVRSARASKMAKGSNAGCIPAMAGAMIALDKARNEPERRKKLRDNTNRLKSGLRRLGLTANDSPTPFLAVSLGDAKTMQALQDRLLTEYGLYVCYSDYTGSGAEGVLRIAAFANHSAGDIDTLLEALAKNL